MSHTQGRWWSERDEHDTRHVIRAENVEHPIANVNSYWRGENCPDRTQREANARLIAAAPELLEAAVAFVTDVDASDLDDLDYGRGLAQSGLIEAFRAAIAKATQP